MLADWRISALKAPASVAAATETEGIPIMVATKCFSDCLSTKI